MAVNDGEDVEKEELSSSAGGSANLYSLFGISMVTAPENGNESTTRSSNSALRHIPKGCTFIQQGHLSAMFITVLFVVARTWKQPRCPLTEECIEKIWYIYTIEYYSTEKTKNKNNGILKFTGKWMELEETILSEVTQS